MHVLSIVLAVVAPFVLGFLWYGPVFGKPWMEETGISKDDPPKTSMPVTFGIAIVLTVVAVLALELCLVPETSGALEGLLYGLIIGVGVAATSLGINYLFSQRSVRLYLIDAGYLVLMFGLIGLFLRIW